VTTSPHAPTVEAIGVHLVEAAEPCHLIELLVHNSPGAFDVAGFTQPLAGEPRSNWQVPYAEKLLNQSGTGVLWDPWTGDGSHALWSGEVRLCFFFHYLDLGSELTTPFGVVGLPSNTPRPHRLDFLTYEEP
jgi:hypothetical protein